MKTSDDYKEALRKLKPKIIIDGEEVKDVTKDPRFIPGINVISATYDLAADPKYGGLMTATSRITGEKINRFTHIHGSNEDLINKIKMTRIYCQKVGGCIQRCMGCDALNAISIVSYQIDQDRGSDYYQHLLKYLEYVQKNDVALSGGITDAKGDRSLRPHEQADPDLNVHVVEKGRDGIVVRGAKANNSITPYVEEVVVLPTQARKEKDADWAVSFATPVDAEGITLVSSAHVLPQKEMENPVSSRYNMADSLTVFDDVFIPWERVFMCGEWEYSGFLARLFGDYHRHSYCGCKPAFSDILLGCAALIAEYNGVAKAPHIRSKLFELIYHGEIIYSCGIASSVMGKRMKSGTFLPDITMCNMGKYHAGISIHDEIALVQDIAGGMAYNVPSEDNYNHAVAGKYIKKYLKGVADIPVEDRIRCFHLIKDLTCSAFAGLYSIVGVIGAGPMEAQRITVLADYDLEEKKNLAKDLAGIKN